MELIDGQLSNLFQKLKTEMQKAWVDAIKKESPNAFADEEKMNHTCSDLLDVVANHMKIVRCILVLSSTQLCNRNMRVALGTPILGPYPRSRPWWRSWAGVLWRCA
jgi:hypothetical protein